MSSNAQRFAQIAMQAFVDQGHVTDDLVHEAGGPSSTYMTGLRKASHTGELREPRSDTYRRIEAAAGWARGSAREVWSGAEPRSIERTLMLSETGALTSSNRVQRRFRADSPEGFMERIFERLLDVEERLDAMADEIKEIRDGAPTKTGSDELSQEHYGQAARRGRRQKTDEPGDGA